MKSRISLQQDNQGQALTEYLMLTLLIAVVSIVATKSLGGTIKAKIEEVRSHINSGISLEQ